MVPLSQVVQLIQPKNEATLNPINLIEYTDETAERHVFAGGCIHSGNHSVFNPKDLMGELSLSSRNETSSWNSASSSTTAS